MAVHTITRGANWDAAHLCVCVQASIDGSAITTLTRFRDKLVFAGKLGLATDWFKRNATHATAGISRRRSTRRRGVLTSGATASRRRVHLLFSDYNRIELMVSDGTDNGTRPVSQSVCPDTFDGEACGHISRRRVTPYSMDYDRVCLSVVASSPLLLLCL